MKEMDDNKSVRNALDRLSNQLDHVKAEIDTIKQMHLQPKGNLKWAEPMLQSRAHGYSKWAVQAGKYTYLVFVTPQGRWYSTGRLKDGRVYAASVEILLESIPMGIQSVFGLSADSRLEVE